MASDAPLEHPFPPSPQKRKPSADLVEAVRKKTGGVSMQHQDATDGGRELEEDDIDADGEDERGDAEENSVTQKLSERRQKQNDAFEDWLSNEAENIWEEDPAQKPGFVTDDTQASVRKIIAQAESTSIIDDPREYQLELFEKAKKENIIAVLDTGLFQV